MIFFMYMPGIILDGGCKGKVTWRYLQSNAQSIEQCGSVLLVPSKGSVKRWGNERIFVTQYFRNYMDNIMPISYLSVHRIQLYSCGVSNKVSRTF